VATCGHWSPALGAPRECVLGLRLNATGAELRQSTIVAGGVA